MQISELSIPNGLGFRARGDFKAEFLQAIFGIVVTASEFHPQTVDPAALVRARLWEGSVTWVVRRTRDSRTIEQASPESLVAQFHNKEKRPPSHFLSDVLRMADDSSERLQGPPDLKTGVSASPDSTRQLASGQSNAIKVDVALVNVPVKVMDKDGKYVSGLTYSDFHLKTIRNRRSTA